MAGKKAPTSSRLKLLKAVQRLPHRYTLARTLLQTLSLSVLVSVPAIGLAKVDLWQGQHQFLFAPARLQVAVGAVVLGIIAMYLMTFLVNAAAGRLFCGWGCPVGQISRLGEQLDAPGLTIRQRWIARLKGAAHSGILVLAIMLWWVDLRVLVKGTGQALALSWATLLGLATAAYLHGRLWRWNFCKNYCPIGMYYSVVSPAQWFGVRFSHAENCINCNACDNVCPVALEPRNLLAEVSTPRGWSVSGMPGRSHCLECGDCIRACEFMTASKGKGPSPLTLSWTQMMAPAASELPFPEAEALWGDHSPAALGAGALHAPRREAVDEMESQHGQQQSIAGALAVMEAPSCCAPKPKLSLQVLQRPASARSCFGSAHCSGLCLSDATRPNEPCTGSGCQHAG